MNKTELNKLKNEYGYLTTSYKYVPMAYEILKCIGQTVILVTYERTKEAETVEGGDKKDPNDVGEWITKTDVARIISISECDPMTLTMKIKYKVLDDPNKKEEDIEEQEMRIQPEGYEFVNAEETGLFRRFQPLSLHHKMMEDEFFFQRLNALYEKRNSLDLEAVKIISESKDQPQVLRYSHNIGAAIKLEDGSLIWIRIHSLRLKHRQGNKYGLFFSSADGREWSTLITSDETEHTIGDWGKFKIIDLSD